MAKRYGILTLLLATLLSSFFLAPAQAATRVKPVVTLDASSTEVTLGDWAYFSGSVSGPSAGALVRLQKWTPDGWRRVARTYADSDGSYYFSRNVSEDVVTYRARVMRSTTLRYSASTPVTLYGLAPVQLADYTLQELRSDLLGRINAYRADHGVAPISLNSTLNTYAQAGSDAQAYNGQTAMRESFADGPSDPIVDREFVTFNGMPADVENFFEYQDPSLLLSDHARLGIGMSLYDDRLGYWTLDFGNDKPAPPPPPQWNEENVRALILQQVNDFRAQNGLRPLALMGALNTEAQNWSRHMADTNTFEHNPNFASEMPSGWSKAGENIAAGQQPDAVVQAWINSPGHRANLLGDYTHIGIGYATNSNSTYKRYYTQDFAKY